jgi:Leucine-rich repeat (LRR) protein
MFTNRIATIDPQTLQGMKTFVIHTSFPLSLRASLRILNLNNNMLTSLPSTIAALTSLEALSIDGNLLTALPSFV